MAPCTLRRIRRAAALVVAPLLVAGAAMATAGAPGALADSPSGPPSALTDNLPDIGRQLAGPAPLPAQPLPQAGSLVEEITTLSSALDVPLDPNAVTQNLRTARLTPVVESALASLVAQLGACTAHTTTLLDNTPLADLAKGGQVSPVDSAALQGCALTLRAGVEALRPVLSDPAAGGPVRLWPILAFSPGDTDDTYVEDYMLTIDQGGDDTYLNNQGGNQIDIKRSVTNPLAKYDEPARGCRQTYPDSTTGRVVPGPDGRRVPSFDGPECVPAAALLWDMAGNDTYGRMEAPQWPDSLCSADPSVARFATIGSGVEGVGMLVDDSGDDHYYGRTGTMGSGHLGGVGLLEDKAGNDHYLAIRNGMGLGLLGGIGVLRDDAGDDVYDYYMPRPLDPAAEFQTDGSGGVIDDSGLGTEAGLSPNSEDRVGGRCDNIPRSLQGVGIFVAPALGILIDGGGDDSYRAAGYRNQEEGLPTQTGTGLIRMAHGSQGSGYLGGIGAMFDLGGSDEYLREEGGPAQDRHDDQFVGPQTHLDLTDVGSPTNGRPLDLSLFYDSE